MQILGLEAGTPILGEQCPQKVGTLVKVVILPLLASLSWKRLQIIIGEQEVITLAGRILFWWPLWRARHHQQQQQQQQQQEMCVRRWQKGRKHHCSGPIKRNWQSKRPRFFPPNLAVLNTSPYSKTDKQTKSILFVYHAFWGFFTLKKRNDVQTPLRTLFTAFF